MSFAVLVGVSVTASDMLEQSTEETQHPGGPCPECSTSTQALQRYCSNCGHQLVGIDVTLQPKGLLGNYIPSSPSPALTEVDVPTVVTWVNGSDAPESDPQLFAYRGGSGVILGVRVGQGGVSNPMVPDADLQSHIAYVQQLVTDMGWAAQVGLHTVLL